MAVGTMAAYGRNAGVGCKRTQTADFSPAGAALDLRTKHLILTSLLVVQGADRALRHVVPIALDAGASPDEVTDAIHLGLPIVGQVRVAGALEQIADLLRPASGAAIAQG